jgi:hypothetical protein
LKQGHASSSLLFIFALEYAIRKVQVNQDGLKLKGTHQFSIYADCVNTLGECLSTAEKYAEALVFSSEEIGLEVNADKTKHMVISRDQNAGQSHNMKMIIASLKRWKSSDIWEQP